MALAEDIKLALVDEALQLQQRQLACKVCAWLRQQSDDEQAEWADVMDNPVIEHQAIQKILQRRGCKISYSTLQRHRLNSHAV